MKANVTSEDFKKHAKPEVKIHFGKKFTDVNKDDIVCKKTIPTLQKERFQSKLRTSSNKYAFQATKSKSLVEKQNKVIKKHSVNLTDFKTEKSFFTKIIFLFRKKKEIKMINFAKSPNLKNNPTNEFLTRLKEKKTKT